MSFRPLHLSFRAFAIATLTIALSLWILTPAGEERVVAQSAQQECETEGEYKALDPVVLLGTEVKSEIFFRVHECPKIKWAPVVYVMVVLDFAGTLAARDADVMTRSANSLLSGLDKSSPGRSKFGVVAFNGNGSEDCEFSSDAQTLRHCTDLDPVRWSETDLGDGLKKADRKFRTNKIPHGAKKIIVLFSDARGSTESNCPSTAIRGNDITVMTVGVGSDPNVSCLKNIASVHNLYFEGAEANMIRVAKAALDEVENELAGVVITNTIAAKMKYVPNSAEPPVDEARWEGDEYVLVWRDPWKNTIPPEDGMKLTFTVQPHHAGGSQPISQKIEGSYRETVGKGGEIRFEIPRIAVMGEQDTATPRPILTPTPVPTEVPPSPPPLEPTATDVAPIPDPVFRLYLPMVQWGEQCPRCPHQNYFDPFRARP